MVDWLPTAEVRAVAPVLDRYSQSVLLGEVWKRPDLSPRDRSLITVSALIARNHLSDLSYHLYWALDNGITPAELSEMVTHLAFYAGWADALAAVPTIKKVFDHRGIGREQLPPVDEDPLPQDTAAEARRADEVARNFGEVAPGVVQYTTELVFGDLWLRPGLAPRDRSLVTIAALVATGHVEQITYHLDRALDSGLTEAEAAEVLTHLAFYVGWPNVFAAMPIVKDVLASRC
ncbi:carboxymuconolactone decarboxylase family protein [Nocardia sp. alder85J]|uniref:carboxymuconolactone decarboxylase family protein n=1 Tax=Nocardia sp. alder85J TaxID=2862949 RepID=UPI001CD4C12B|nr:carboxymuconolactone decarboxylase family protein [Nocardia sp. alder85J]MCX4091811.1 carboxymuconolactone decarboxylase family protein [Nocardia sp. alder85J]